MGGDDRLARAVRRMARRARAQSTGEPVERIERVEQELREVRGRVNALFFTVLAVALGDLVGRVLVG